MKIKSEVVLVIHVIIQILSLTTMLALDKICETTPYFGVTPNSIPWQLNVPTSSVTEATKHNPSDAKRTNADKLLY